MTTTDGSTAVHEERPEVGANSGAKSWSIAVLFAVTAFVGAGLLFVVQPMAAKLLLPSYGGSATVWSTSSLFFQVLLLIAYGYAHWSTTRLGARWQPRTHVLLLAAAAFALPVVLPGTSAPEDGMHPALWLLRTLFVMIGLPFAVVATTGPLLQRWYSWTGRTRSEDPYFLFAASNLGSFGGLLAYPLVVEPSVALADQRAWWSWGFFGFAALTTACAALASRMRSGEPGPVDAGQRGEPLARFRIVFWMALAFVPSSLMLGITTHISTDVAAIPLLWVVPLAIYLATFVIAFARSSRSAPAVPTRAAAAVALVALLISVVPTRLPVTLSLVTNLLLLALVGFAGHARLAADRPATENLTKYYLAVAFGGALGGLFNGLVAPMVFERVLEYQLVLVAVPLLLLGLQGQSKQPTQPGGKSSAVRSVSGVVALVLTGFLLMFALLKLSDTALLLAVTLFAAVLLGWFSSRWPAALLVVCLVSYGVPLAATHAGVLERSRSFYGSYAVRQSGDLRTLTHGTTVHGSQFVGDRKRLVPTTYYSRRGPLGDVFRLLDVDRFGQVAVVGLGAGTVAAYGRTGQTMTFFEIDPGVVDFARNDRLFSYLSDSRANVETVVGDGRLQVTAVPVGSFDLLVLDAFSSDSIPVHLLTEEAMEIYASRLTRDGVLLVHISNRVFDLRPVLANAADHLGWSAAVGSKTGESPAATSSVWVALSRDTDAISRLMSEESWSAIDGRRVRWTDDYSSVLGVLR